MELKEAKEKLPVSFLTDFISRGWDDVGYLKETIKSIGDNFTGTKKVEELLQALLDAYLVCIGQLEMHLEDKDYLDIPEEAKKLTEDVNITVTPEEVRIADNSGEEVAIIPTETEEEKFEPVPVEDGNGGVKEVCPACGKEAEPEKKELPDTEFDFFVDFDDPVPETGNKLTDQEIEEMMRR